MFKMKKLENIPEVALWPREVDYNGVIQERKSPMCREKMNETKPNSSAFVTNLHIEYALVKKIVAYFLESEIEVEIWRFKRWGYKGGQHFQKGFPAGAFFPLISKIFLFPLNGCVWMASLVFDVKAKVYHAAKRHGIYSFSEMTEEHVGLIAAAGIFINLLLAFIFYFVGGNFGILFAKMNIWYAFFNMIPISNLDGNKIFFGNLVLWSFLAIITLIGFGYSLFLI